MDYNHSEDHNHCNFHKNIHKSGNMIVHHLNRFPRNFPVQIDTPQKIHHTSRRTQLNNLQVHRDIPAVLEALVVLQDPYHLGDLDFHHIHPVLVDHWHLVDPYYLDHQYHLGFQYFLGCLEALDYQYHPYRPAAHDHHRHQLIRRFLDFPPDPWDQQNPPDLATPMIHFFRLVASKEPIH